MLPSYHKGPSCSCIQLTGLSDRHDSDRSHNFLHGMRLSMLLFAVDHAMRSLPIWISPTSPHATTTTFGYMRVHVDMYAETYTVHAL